MKVLAHVLAAVLGLGGVVFLLAAGHANTVPRVVVALVLLAAAATLVALVRLRPQRVTHVNEQRLHLSGDVSLEELTCSRCAGPLGQRSVTTRAGAVFVDCQHCGATYQIEEEPKW